MKRRVICFLVLSLFILSSTAFATNWVYVMQFDLFGDGTITTWNVDSQTVSRKDNTVYFWQLVTYGDVDPMTDEAKSTLYREVWLGNPRRIRTIESYSYDQNNRQVGFDAQPGPWKQVNPGERLDKLIDVALRYAITGQNTSDVNYGTLRFDYTYQAGPYVRILHGTVKDPQGLWQALLPLQPPPGARGGYGLIGDDSLLGEAPGFGLRQLGSIARRYITFDSIYVEQPSGFSEIGVQAGRFTTVDALNDTTLGWVFFDLRPKFEADLKKHLNLAL